MVKLNYTIIRNYQQIIESNQKLIKLNYPLLKQQQDKIETTPQA